MSPLELEELKRQIEKYLAAGMIEPSSSPYGAACLFAPKKTGILRFCIDYRPLNNITVKNAVQPPAADDCLNQMAGCSIFSTLDLAQGYNQIPIAEDDRHKTGFNTKYGHYQWRVMPFGLCNAPATFVSVMNKIFSGEAHRLRLDTAHGAHNDRNRDNTPQQEAEKTQNLLDKFVSVYIDDIIIYSKTPDEHAEHLRIVFERLREYGLLIQSPKSFYAQQEVDYLGHIVSAQGIKMQTPKVESVQDWPQPKTVSEVRQFLGLSGYYRRFVKDYASIARPMIDLTKKDQSDKDGKITWTTDHQISFDKLKDTLCSAPVLAIPDIRRGKFHINCDASTFGL